MDCYWCDEIGYIYQFYNLINYLMVIENVCLFLDMIILSVKEVIDWMMDFLKWVGLSEYVKKYLS